MEEVVAILTKLADAHEAQLNCIKVAFFSDTSGGSVFEELPTRNDVGYMTEAIRDSATDLSEVPERLSEIAWSLASIAKSLKFMARGERRPPSKKRKTDDDDE
jgi:hypothetical protein